MLVIVTPMEFNYLLICYKQGAPMEPFKFVDAAETINYQDVASYIAL